MQRKLILIVLFSSAFAACAASLYRPTSQTGVPFWPMEPGTGMGFNVASFSGATWNDTTYALDLPGPTTPVGPGAAQQRISYSQAACPALYGTNPLYVLHYTFPGQPDLPVNFGSALQESIGTVGGVQFIGDAINYAGAAAVPPIGYLPLTPSAGQVIETTSNIYESCANNTVIQTLHWKSKVVAFYANWGPHADVVRTGLREFHSQANPAVPDCVYNYIFKRGVGLVQFFYGCFQPGGTVAGHVYYGSTSYVTTITPTATASPAKTLTPTPTAIEATPTPVATRTPECHYFENIDNQVCVP